VGSKQNFIKKLFVETDQAFSIVFDGSDFVRQAQLAISQASSGRALSDMVGKIQSSLPDLVSRLTKIMDEMNSKNIARLAKNGSWDAVAHHIQNGGELDDELRVFLVSVLNGKRRDGPNRPPSFAARQRHTQIAEFVVKAVRGGQTAAAAYRDAASHFGMTSESVERVCKECAAGLVRGMVFDGHCETIVKNAVLACKLLLEELARRGEDIPRYEVSKGALTGHFVAPCLLRTS
jgi:hypothetical protein